MKKIFLLLISISAILITGCATIAQTPRNDDVYYQRSKDTVYIQVPQEDNEVDVYINIMNPTPVYAFSPYYNDITWNWSYSYYPFYYSYYWYRPYVWYNYDYHYWDYYRWNRPNYYWGYNYHDWHNYNHYHHGNNQYGNNHNNYNDNRYIGHRNAITTGNDRRNNNNNNGRSGINSRNKQKPQVYKSNSTDRFRPSNEYDSPKYKSRFEKIIQDDRNTIKPKTNSNTRRVVPSTQPVKPNRVNPYNKVRQEPRRVEPSNNYNRQEPRRVEPNKNYNNSKPQSTRSNGYSAPRQSNSTRSSAPSNSNYRKSSSPSPSRSYSSPSRSSSSGGQSTRSPGRR